MPRLQRLLVLATVVLAAAMPLQGCDPSRDGTSSEVVAWELPKRLSEASGLAVMGHELLIHADEQAVVYAFDPDTGDWREALRLGSPIVKGDFEGVAVFDDRLYLITSDGLLYDVAWRDEPGTATAWNSVDTGLSATCEIEGLAVMGASLLIACKQNYAEQDADVVLTWLWSPREATLVPHLRIPRAPITAALDSKRFEPSAVALDGDSLLLLSAHPRSLVRVNLDGELLAAMRFRKSAHRQPEGLALMGSRLLVADEASGKRATLTVYPASPLD